MPFHEEMHKDYLSTAELERRLDGIEVVIRTLMLYLEKYIIPHCGGPDLDNWAREQSKADDQCAT